MFIQKPALTEERARGDAGGFKTSRFMGAQGGVVLGCNMQVRLHNTAGARLFGTKGQPPGRQTLPPPSGLRINGGDHGAVPGVVAGGLPVQAGCEGACFERAR